VRIDSALQPGDEVSLHYDPLVAKLIAWGRDRDHAIARMERALGEIQIVGIRTSIPFHREVLAGDAFRRGAFDIGWDDRELPRIAAALGAIGPDARTAAILAAVAAAEAEGREPARRRGVSPWALSGRRAMMAARAPRVTVV
jgi:acetyl/propionyl-CoA carboxylase alpha subunit